MSRPDQRAWLARRDCWKKASPPRSRRRGVVAAARAAVALAGVDRVLERQLERVVLDHHPVELGARHRPPRERRGGGGEEERGQPLAPAARVDARIREDQALARLRDGAVEERGAPRAGGPGWSGASGHGARRRGGDGHGEARRRGLSRRSRRDEVELGGLAATTRNEERPGRLEQPEIPRAPRETALGIPQRLPLRVQEKGIRPEHARVAALHEAGDRDHAERQARHRVEGAHVDGAALERLERQPLPLEARLDHLLDLAPRRARGDRAEAAEVGDHLEHRLAVALRAEPLVDDRPQPLDPLGPRGLAGQASSVGFRISTTPQQRVGVGALRSRRSRRSGVALASRPPRAPPPDQARRPTIQRL